MNGMRRTMFWESKLLNIKLRAEKVLNCSRLIAGCAKKHRKTLTGL